LLVEDEPGLALVLTDRLEREGYSVVSVQDGVAAVDTALRIVFDAIVLDVMLPLKNGFEVCRELRAQGSTVPILMLTARGEVTDRVTGLKSGADDYLAKPFDTAELLARIEALLRRAKGASATAAVYAFGPVQVNTRRREVWRDGDKVTLSAKEYQLLCYLLERPVSWCLATSCSSRSGVIGRAPTRAPWMSTWDNCGASSRRIPSSPVIY
jgi:DNA-binding response OmpR family regulator